MNQSLSVPKTYLKSQRDMVITVKSAILETYE